MIDNFACCRTYFKICAKNQGFNLIQSNVAKWDDSDRYQSYNLRSTVSRGFQLCPFLLLVTFLRVVSSRERGFSLSNLGHRLAATFQPSIWLPSIDHYRIPEGIMADSNKRKGGPGDDRDNKYGKKSKVRYEIILFYLGSFLS